MTDIHHHFEKDFAEFYREELRLAQEEAAWFRLYVCNDFSCGDVWPEDFDTSWSVSGESRRDSDVVPPGKNYSRTGEKPSGGLAGW